MKLIYTGLLLVGLLLSTQAFAHATLIGSDPADGANLREAPDYVHLQFDEEARLLDFTVTDAAGQEVPTEFQRSGDESDHFRIATVDSMAAAKYTVEWVIMSQDGHRMSGNLSFEIQ